MLAKKNFGKLFPHPPLARPQLDPGIHAARLNVLRQKVTPWAGRVNRTYRAATVGFFRRHRHGKPVVVSRQHHNAYSRPVHMVTILARDGDEK